MILDTHAKIPKLKKVIYFLHIYQDGIGDLRHLIDVHRALSEYLISWSVSYVLVVKYWELHEKYIDTFVANEKTIAKCYKSEIGSNVDLSLNAELTNDLENSLLVFQISCNFPEIDKYLKHITKNTNVIQIDEHERLYSPILPKNDERYHLLGMGLGKDKFGIKLTEQAFKATKKSLDTMSDARFNNLIKSNNALEIIPSYVNKSAHLMRAILFFCTNKSLKDKNLLIYHSAKQQTGKYLTKKLKKYFSISKEPIDEDNQYLPYIRDSGFKSVTIIDYSQSASPMNITIDAHGVRDLIIVTGLYLNDSDYNILISNAKYSICSGDNSLEKCINNNILPYYFSTHASDKVDTITSLNSICKSSSPPISDNVSNNFITYFSEDFFKLAGGDSDEDINSTYTQPLLRELIDKFSNLNLIEMSANWPTICDKLRKDHNFYTAFKNTIYTCIPSIYLKTTGSINTPGSFNFSGEKDNSSTQQGNLQPSTTLSQGHIKK